MRHLAVHGWGPLVLLACAVPGTSRATPESRSTLAIAVTPLETSPYLPSDLSGALTRSLRLSLEQLGAFDVVDGTGAPERPGTGRTQGGAGTVKAGSPGSAPPFDYLVRGSVAYAEGRYLVQLQLVKAADGLLENRIFRDYAGDVAGLSGDVGIAARILVRQLLEAPPGRVVLLIAEAGVRVRVDGTPVGASPLGPLSLPGGVHTLELAKEGFARFRKDFVVEGGSEVVLAARLVPLAAQGGRQRAAVRPSRALAWGGFALGAAGLAGGGALYALSVDRAKALERDISAYNASPVRSSTEAESLSRRRSDLANLNTLAIGSAAVGVAGIATGTILYRWGGARGPHGDAGDAAAAGLELAPLPRGVALQLRF